MVPRNDDVFFKINLTFLEKCRECALTHHVGYGSHKSTSITFKKKLEASTLARTIGKLKMNTVIAVW